MNVAHRSSHIQRLSGIYYQQALRISKQLDLFDQQHEEITQEQLTMNKNNLKHTCISMSIPGIGPKTALAIRAYLGTMERFESRHQVGYYAGLVPRVDCSGEQNRYYSITKRGPRELRRLLNQAAWSLVRSKQPCQLLMFYKKISARCGYKKAIVALSRKIIELLYTLHKKQVVFCDPFLEATSSTVETKLKKYKLVDESFSLNLLFSGQKT